MIYFGTGSRFTGKKPIFFRRNLLEQGLCFTLASSLFSKITGKEFIFHNSYAVLSVWMCLAMRYSFSYLLKECLPVIRNYYYAHCPQLTFCTISQRRTFLGCHTSSYLDLLFLNIVPFHKVQMKKSRLFELVKKYLTYKKSFNKTATNRTDWTLKSCTILHRNCTSRNISNWRGPIRIIKSKSLLLTGLPQTKPHH